MSQVGRFVSVGLPIDSLTGDIVGAVGPDGLGNFNILGGGGIVTTGTPATNTITIDVDGTVATQYDGNVGTAIPAANILNVLGNGVNTNITGAGNTLTVDLVNGANGQLLIGGGADPIWASLTSGDGSITFATGANTLDLEVAGGTFVQTLTGDSGGAVGPTAADNISILGNPDINVVGTPGINTLQLTNLTKLSPYVVGTDATQYRFTTVQAAINQAVADGVSAANPAIVYVTPGTYSENVALSAHVSVEAATAGNYVDNVIIEGNMTGPTGAGFLALSGITITSPNATAALNISAAVAVTMEISHCNIFADNGDGFNISSATTELFIDCTRFSATATEKYFDITNGMVRFTNCYFDDTTVPSTISLGSVFIRDSVGEALSLDMSGGTLLMSNTFIASGFNPCIDLGAAGAVALVYNCVMGSASATGFYVTGNGILLLSGVTPNSTADAIDPALTFTMFEPFCVGNLSFDGGGTQIDTNGQLIIGSTGTVPQIATLTAGTGINIVNGAGSITISSTGGGMTASAQTTDATPTVLITESVAEDEMKTIRAVVNGFEDTKDDAAGAQVLITAFRDTGGNVTLVGTPVVDLNTSDAVNVDGTVDIGTQTVRVVVTGIAAQTWDWNAEYNVVTS